MRKKLTILAFLVAIAAPTLGGSSASIKAVDDLSRSNGCPKGSYPFSCAGYTYCCPNGALCTCGPY